MRQLEMEQNSLLMESFLKSREYLYELFMIELEIDKLV